MIRKYHNRKPQKTPWHREEELLNHHQTPGRQIKQSNQLSLPRVLFRQKKKIYILANKIVSSANFPCVTSVKYISANEINNLFLNIHIRTENNFKKVINITGTENGIISNILKKKEAIIKYYMRDRPSFFYFSISFFLISHLNDCFASQQNVEMN